MTALALAIVLFSACLHAFWNLILKRANGGLPLLFLIVASMVGVFAPVAVYVIVTQRPVIGWPEIIAMAGNGVLQMIYFYLLNQSYRFGDMSLVYPLARGSGPLIVTIFAIAFLGERPTPLAIGGATLIAVGVLLLSGNFKALKAEGAFKGVVYALMTGATIAFYTLWDRYAVRDLAINPLLYLFAGAVVQTLILLPYAARHVPEVREEWRAHWKSAVTVAALSQGAYGLILFALTFSPVSYIAPAREISVLIGSMMGSRVLAEQQSMRRVAAAVAMLVGMIGLALG